MMAVVCVQFLARQVTVLCVCACMMAVVCVQRLYYPRLCRELSPDSRKKRGLGLSPEEEKLLAPQVPVHCVCACMMAVVCAQLLALGDCTQCRS